MIYRFGSQKGNITIPFWVYLKNMAEWCCVHLVGCQAGSGHLSLVSYDYVVQMVWQPWCDRWKDSTFKTSKISAIYYCINTNLSQNSSFHLGRAQLGGFSTYIIWDLLQSLLGPEAWFNDTLEVTVTPATSPGHCPQGSMSAAGWNLGSQRARTELLKVTQFHWYCPLPDSEGHQHHACCRKSPHL